MTDSALNPSNLLSLAFAVLLAASVLLKLWLASRQMRHVAAHRHAVPAAFAQQISLEDHLKAASYTIAQGQFGLLELAWGTAVLLGWTLLGGLSLLNGWIGSLVAPGLGQQVALVVAFGAIGGVLDLPWAAWRTFVLEQRFGFNRTTVALWLQDLLKSTVVGALIGIPLVALVLWLMGATGSLWWLWTWGVWMGFNLLMLVVYPTWIAPLFNKFQPIEDAALKARVTALMQRCGFTSKGFYVMDGSRRSAHANAYFTGFGSAKRVVFYDTLLSQLSPAEVDAVLAHELGHFKHKHITKRIVSTFALSLAALALLGWLSQQVWFYTGLGVQPNILAPTLGAAASSLPPGGALASWGGPAALGTGGNDALALLLFMMAMPVVTSFVSPLFAQISRKHEFEADVFAAQNANGEDLANALLKLYKDNASTLTPDPVYVKFYYSHPPASERIARMVAHG